MGNSSEMRGREFEVQTEKTHTRIKICADRLDALLAPWLKSELVVLSGSGVTNIVMDLNGIAYCDSSGLSAILVAHRLCRTVSGTFVLTGLSKEVERLIAISQLDSVLRIAYTEAQVEEMLSHGGDSNLTAD